MSEEPYVVGSTASQRRLEREAAQFVEFVLRHTQPERAKAHGAETVHSIIKHHPFAKQHASKHSP